MSSRNFTFRITALIKRFSFYSSDNQTVLDNNYYKDYTSLITKYCTIFVAVDCGQNIVYLLGVLQGQLQVGSVLFCKLRKAEMVYLRIPEGSTPGDTPVRIRKILHLSFLLSSIIFFLLLVNSSGDLFIFFFLSFTKKNNNNMNKIIQGDCLEKLKELEDNSIDLTVTSPPYDNLRTYNGYTFNFEGIAKELYRVTKQGGVVVWVVGDQTINGSETGTSFKQALYFKEIGFNLHDTMIYRKVNPIPLTHNRYEQGFEYMFVFSKGKPKTFNPIMVNCKTKGLDTKRRTFYQKPDGILEKGNKNEPVKDTKQKDNVWEIPTYSGKYGHPAIFPEKLAEDHILSWSNEGDTVLDPMCGSGTTLKMAKKNNRNYIGIEISPEYIEIIKQRLQ